MNISKSKDLESKDLLALERVIEKGRQQFVEVGLALAEIRQTKLYKIRYDTFEQYCQERWGWKRRYAYNMIEAASVVKALPESVRNCAQTESQSRELAKADPEQRAEVLEVVAAQGPVTAAAIREEVERRAEPEPEPEPPRVHSADEPETAPAKPEVPREVRDCMTRSRWAALALEQQFNRATATALADEWQRGADLLRSADEAEPEPVSPPITDECVPDPNYTNEDALNWWWTQTPEAKGDFVLRVMFNGRKGDIVVNNKANLSAKFKKWMKECVSQAPRQPATPPPPLSCVCGKVLNRNEDDLEAMATYECGDCGEQFTSEETDDGEGNRCPSCNKFAAKIGFKCPDCENVIEEAE